MDEALILTPALATSQDGKLHTVEFRVRIWGEHIDAAERVTGVNLWDGSGSLTRTVDGELATMLVCIPVRLADKFRLDTGQALGWYLMGKLIRVRGTIVAEQVAIQTLDGSWIQHARARIDITDLTQIQVVWTDRREGAAQSGL